MFWVALGCTILSIGMGFVTGFATEAALPEDIEMFELAGAECEAEEGGRGSSASTS